MHETDEDLVWLQSLLDRSYDRAGEHLRSITTPARRIPAVELGDLLPGVQILDVATVTSDGRPRVAPVDGLFFRGHFYFGSSRTSLRYRHLRTRPQVSAAHTRGEEMSVVVHGTARLFSFLDPDRQEFRNYCHEVYLPATERAGRTLPAATTSSMCLPRPVSRPKIQVSGQVLFTFI